MAHTHPDTGAYPILAMLAALALTYAQGLLSLDGGQGATRYRLLPLRGWQVLAAKDAAYLAILLILVLPSSRWPGAGGFGTGCGVDADTRAPGEGGGRVGREDSGGVAT